MPTISVIIPTHNRVNILKKVLLSLQSQTIPSSNYEVIVVDDASTDETPHAIKQWELPPNFFYIRQTRGGPAKARNTGLRKAIGDIVLFLDDDVTPTSRLLEEHLKSQKGKSKVAVLGYTPFAENLVMTPIMKYHNDMWQRIFNKIEDIQRTGKQIPFYYFITINVSVKKELVIEAGMFDEILVAWFEDTELGQRLYQRGVTIEFNKKALAFHHVTSRSLNISEDLHSLATTEEKKGYRAGIFYSIHPDNHEMNERFWVDYVFCKHLPDEQFFTKVRKLFRKHLLNDITINLFFKLLPQLEKINKVNLLHYCYSMIKLYHYSKGFKRAVYERIR